jgi:hypothetical protein
MVSARAIVKFQFSDHSLFVLKFVSDEGKVEWENVIGTLSVVDRKRVLLQRMR